MNYRVSGVGALEVLEEVSWLDPLVGILEFLACLTSGRVATAPFQVARRAGLDGYRKKAKYSGFPLATVHCPRGLCLPQTGD